MPLVSPDASRLRSAVAAVVAAAAGLLLVDIVLALVVARRSRQIGDGLQRLRETTADLRRVPEMKRTLEQMTRYLQAIRRGEVG